MPRKASKKQGVTHKYPRATAMNPFKRISIAAMPGWKSDVGRRLDELIVRSVPNVRKAVRWNTPF
jgi:hypothetical protein